MNCNFHTGITHHYPEDSAEAAEVHRKAHGIQVAVVQGPTEQEILGACARDELKTASSILGASLTGTVKSLAEKDEEWSYSATDPEPRPSPLTESTGTNSARSKSWSSFQCLGTAAAVGIAGWLAGRRSMLQ